MSDIGRPTRVQIASGSVKAAATPAWGQALGGGSCVNGFSGLPVRSAAGVYVLTFAEPQPISSDAATTACPLVYNVCLLSTVAAAVVPSAMVVLAANGASITVTTSNGTALADIPFTITVDRILRLS